MNIKLALAGVGILILVLSVLTAYDIGYNAGRPDCYEDEVWDWVANDTRACVTVDDRYVPITEVTP